MHSWRIYHLSSIYPSSSHLHIFTDEKWTNSVVKQFIKSSELNQEFVVLFKDNSQAQAPKYALNPHLPLIKIVINSEEYDVLISKIGNYSAVFIHYLCDLKFNLIEKVVKPTKLIWMCWGQDIHKMIISWWFRGAKVRKRIKQKSSVLYKFLPLFHN